MCVRHPRSGVARPSHPGSRPVTDIRAWLAEDVGAGDVTSEALVSADVRCVASLLLKEPGVVSGLGGGIRTAVRLARSTGFPVEVECETLAEVCEALEAGADRILLDNMTVVELTDAVAVTAGKAELEASGGITLDTVRAVAETGVDFISVGALTHSARSLDVSLELLGAASASRVT